MTPEQINAAALALTRQQSSAQLVEAWQITETRMAEIRSQQSTTETINGPQIDPSDEWSDLATSRGWIMDVMEERGELPLIGLDEEYNEIPPRCVEHPAYERDYCPGCGTETKIR